MIEPDPESSEHLFVITEDQMVHKIKDVEDGKAIVDDTINLLELHQNRLEM